MKRWWLAVMVGGCAEVPDGDLDTKDAVCNAIAQHITNNEADFRGDLDPVYVPELRDCENVLTVDGAGTADALVVQPAAQQEYHRRWSCSLTEYDQGWEVDDCTLVEDVGWVAR